MISDDILKGIALLSSKEKVCEIYFHFDPNKSDGGMGRVYEADCACALGAAIVGHDGTTKQEMGTTTERLNAAYSYLRDLIPFRPQDRALIVEHLRRMNYQMTANYWADEAPNVITLYHLIETLSDRTSLTLEQIAQIVKENGR